MNYKEKYSWFYNTPEWKKRRNYKFYEADGLCEQCWKNGIVEQGVEVHHIEPISKNWNKRLDYENLILLCPDCHNHEHHRESELQKFLNNWEEI
jgi:5-methylcytosine-specific restriction protein A